MSDHQALRLESAWKANCCATKPNTYNPKYQQAYEEFFLQKSASNEYSGHFKACQPYYSAIAVAHNLQWYGLWDKLVKWSNCCVDFLDPKYNAHACIGQMHSLSVLIINGIRKFLTKEKIAAILFEALKSCAGHLIV